MNSQTVVAIVLLVLTVSVAAGGYAVYRKVRRKVTDFSNAVFGTDSLIEGWNKQADELASTPKSVSGMTRIFAPQIERDFPDFNLNQFKNKVENMLVSALRAIDEEDDSMLSETTEELRQQVVNRIEMNRSEGVREVYEQVTVHRTRSLTMRSVMANVSSRSRARWDIYIIKRRMERPSGEMQSGSHRRSITWRFSIFRMRSSRRWETQSGRRARIAAHRLRTSEPCTVSTVGLR